MISKILNGLLIVIAIALVGHYFYSLPKYDEGQLAPVFEAKLLNGEDFSLNDLKGQYVLLDFWGSWCGPCRRESKELVELNLKQDGNRYKDASGFKIVSIAIEDNEKSWKNAVRVDHLRWKFHIGEMDRFSSPIAMLYGVKEIPTKYLIGPDGNILGVNQSIDEIDNFLLGEKVN